jgi:hypothetical protein
MKEKWGVEGGRKEGREKGRKKERREGGKRGEGGEATILKALISTPRTTRRKKKKPL